MKRFFAFWTLLVLLGCTDQKPPTPPENILPEKKFMNLMVDIHLIEAAINQKFVKLNDSTQTAYRFYKHLFDKHEISRTDFDSTFNYYMRNPKLMNEIYTQVHDSLKALSDDLTENEEKYQRMEKAAADTLFAADSISVEKEVPGIVN